MQQFFNSIHQFLLPSKFSRYVIILRRFGTNPGQKTRLKFYHYTRPIDPATLEKCMYDPRNSHFPTQSVGLLLLELSLWVAIRWNNICVES
jgi:hypothetical protein